MRAEISVVINTLNEERCLPWALRSVRPWADEIVVVDMHSDDRTAEIARSFGAVVHEHPRVGFVEPARAFAVEASRGDWILILDADEIVPPALAKKLRAISERADVDAVRIPRLNYLLGAPLRHSGWGPAQDRHMRFFRRGRLVRDDRLHAPIRAVAGARVLDLPANDDCVLVHFNYTDVADFLARLDRYTSVEASAMTSERADLSTPRAAAAAMGQFLQRYFWRGGWMDGWRGFHLSAFMSFYWLVAVAKARERSSLGSREAVQLLYAREAERWLSDSRGTGAPGADS